MTEFWGSGVSCAARRCGAAVALSAACVATTTAQTPSTGPSGVKALVGVEPAQIRITPQSVRVTNYLNDLAGPVAILKLGVGSTIDHLQGDPHAWGDDEEGYAKRLLGRVGQHAIKTSVRHGLAAVMHRSTGYQPCNCEGTWNRIEHALLETVTDRRRDGSRAFSVPQFAGAYAGSFSRMLWEPDVDAGDVAVGTTVSFGFSALVNVARELTGLR